jgi:thioredoxin reductase
MGAFDPMSVAALAVGGVVAGALVLSSLRARRTEVRQERLADRAVSLGQTEPASLHPRIDEHTCICSAACVAACPEKDVIGFVDGRPSLIRPSACIGHGACATACPVQAITLVLGTERRGVHLPVIGQGGLDFQTNVPGLFIAGELGGMGLIHNAVNQGVQATRSVVASLAGDAAAPEDAATLDLLIVGAGPAGLGAALEAKARGLRFALVDQEALGGALRSFPRQKVVMTAPVDLPLFGKVKLRRTTKEALLELWSEVVDKTGLVVEEQVKVDGVTREGARFILSTSKGERRARRVILAIGRRGTPRKLGIPGETLDKVTYRLLEPEQYRGKRCVVVGGGDAAVETALLLSKEPNAQVTLLHRGHAFDRLKPDNFDALEAARVTRQLVVRTSTRPIEILPDAVRVEGPAGEDRLDNDFVFVCAGGELPTAWLEKLGVAVRVARGEALAAAGGAAGHAGGAA